MHVWRLALVLSLALVASVRRADAAYPERNIALIVPFAAGGANDSVARIIGNKLSQLLGQSIVVENRPGGGTTIGTAAVARAKPDGYTLLLASAAHTITPHLLKGVPYKTLEDFTAIIQLTRTAYVLVTGAGSPVKTIQDLAALAVAGGRMTFASSGAGSAPHLAGQLLATRLGVSAAHVPFQGGAPAVIAVLRGDVDVYFSSVTGARSLIEAGQLRAIAVSSDRRLSMLPELPTLAETGVAGLTINAWYGVLGPARLPADVVATLNGGLVKVLGDPEMVSRLRLEGEDVVASSPDAFETLLRTDLEQFGRLVADAGWKPN